MDKLSIGSKNIQRQIILFTLIILIFVFGFIAGITPYVLSSGFLTSSDSYLIVANAQNIIDHFQLIRGSVYQLFQVMVAISASLTGIDATQSFIFIVGLATGLLSLTTFLIAKKIFNSNIAGYIAGFLTVGLPFISRAIVLTPQNIIGFLFSNIALYLLIIFLDHPSFGRFFIAFIYTCIILLIHPLSFGIFLISAGIYLCFYSWHKITNRWLLILSFFGLIFLIIGGLTLTSFVLTGSKNVLGFVTRFLVEISTSGLNEGSVNIIKIRQYPIVFGSLTIYLALFSLFIYFFRSSHPIKYKGIVIMLLFVPLLWANLYLIGVNFLSYRVILYIWLPISILIAYFFLWYRRKFRETILMLTLFFIISFTAIGFQSIVNHYNEYGKNFVPTLDDKEALKWLVYNIGHSQNQILTIERWPNIQNNIFGYLYPNLGFFVVTDLTESETPPTPPEYVAMKPTNAKLLGKLILTWAPQDDINSVRESNEKNYQKRLELFYGSKFPDSERGSKALDKWGITYAYIFKNIKEYSKFKKSTQFQVVYQNDSVAIFEKIKVQ